MKPAGPLTGALVGLLVTAALVAVLFLTHRALGAPFVPFDLFDWLARVLPGSVVTFGIDAIVDTILVLNLGSVSDVAKTAEQALAIGLFLLGGLVAGASLFAATGRRGASHALVPASVFGVVLGIGALLVSLSVNAQTSARPLISGLWLVLVFFVWGFALARSRDRLAAADRVARRTPKAGEGAAAGRRASSSTEASCASVERLDRRRFLMRLGGATALITVAGTGIGALLRDEEAPLLAGVVEGQASPSGAWSTNNPLPNAGASLAPAPGTRPEFTPLEEHYRIDINTRVPSVDEAGWALRVTGLVDGPREFTLEALRRYQPLHQFVTLACISNRLGGDLISTTRWTGVSLQRLLPDLGLADEATHLRITSVDGFFEIVALETILSDERVMLTYAWDGLPLPQRNGFPLRIYVPDVYGMKQPKWIDSIEAIDGWEAGYWVRRGWDADARMRATSVIDTVATDMMIEENQRMLVPVGGIAHAGARGIDRVEVRVDDGEWREARLRRPLSGTTWVIWRYDWLFEAGRHTLTVRCVDGNGQAQVAERNPVRPSGATGLLSEEVMLAAEEAG